MKTKGRRQSRNVEDIRKTGQSLGSYAKAAWTPVGEVVGLFPSPQGIGPRKPKHVNIQGSEKFLSGMKKSSLGLRGTK